ncbi:mucin-1-like [Rosa chinensis]|uniref:mucin-1-like n=1 Tax=Rosa chinensis TaxID=74649 RepID=UPI000D0970E3|nr:mucin-1-like [Rosa chinensis]
MAPIKQTVRGPKAPATASSPALPPATRPSRHSNHLLRPRDSGPPSSAEHPQALPDSPSQSPVPTPSSLSGSEHSSDAAAFSDSAASEPAPASPSPAPTSQRRSSSPLLPAPPSKRPRSFGCSTPSSSRPTKPPKTHKDSRFVTHTQRVDYEKYTFLRPVVYEKCFNVAELDVLPAPNLTVVREFYACCSPNMPAQMSKIDQELAALSIDTVVAALYEDHPDATPVELSAGALS